MITCLRDVRRAKGLTLQDVADRCVPPTTAQTIGRLETGTRTVSVGWLNRIAAALGVDAADLVRLPDRIDLPVLAMIGADGAHAPARPLSLTPPAPTAGAVALLVESSIGDYRSGDEIWCERVAPDGFARALNRDVLVPRPAGRFAFGRLIGAEEDRLLLLPPGAGSRQQVVTNPAWIAIATRLVRILA
ncbi:MAG: helix-turn-helix transcriptional regulator [Sphingomonas sp.]|nr:helix-turn-helix transcriptional regulator [Sphingomonas sp.]MDX3885822.1 helix-turn-helix transcriptional regulator [Sphingomonas sp.]